MTRCTVYRSSRKAFTYLYVRDGLELEELPVDLLKLLGEPEAIMELDLAERRSLAQENVATVIAHLDDPGYHLQLPPDDDPSGWLELPKRAR